ncbi:MAG: hypothetical protein RLY78_2346 [Pseudomonadota bacterium]
MRPATGSRTARGIRTGIGAVGLLLALTRAAAAAATPAAAAVAAAPAASTAPAAWAAPVAPPAAWSTTLRIDHHLDALALSDAGQDDLGPRLRLDRPGRQLGRIDDEWRLTRHLASGWRLGVVARQRATLSVSRAALEAARSADDDRPALQDEHWPARLRLQAWSGQGLVIGRSVVLADTPTDTSTASPSPPRDADAEPTGRPRRPATGRTLLTLEGQLLRLDRWRQRSVDGQVLHTAATDDYSGRLVSTAMDSRTAAPFGPAPADHGLALLSSGRISHHLSPHGEIGPVAGSRLWLSWHDAGWLRWRRRSIEQATLDTEATWRDADGYLVYSPLIVGQWQRDDSPVWQTPDWSLGAEWLDPGRAGAPGERPRAGTGVWGWSARRHAHHGWRHTLGWQRRQGSAAWAGWADAPDGPAGMAGTDWAVQGVAWTPQERRLSLWFGHADAWLEIGGDRLDRTARSMRLAFGWRWADGTSTATDPRRPAAERQRP